MAVTGELKLDTVQVIEVDSDPRDSIEENFKAGSIAIWNNNGTPVIFKKLNDPTSTAWEIFHSSFLLLSEDIGGSSSNAGGQVFDVDLSNLFLKIGDKVILDDIYFRGDFSGTNEFLDVLIDGQSFTIAQYSSTDDSDYKRDIEFERREVTTIDIGGGIVGIRFTIDPSNEVNFSPAGMPNGWWWQIKCDITRF
jgi:hypothetical protein